MSSAPLASIVTPVYNSWHFTKRFLESIYASLEDAASRPAGDVEVVIIDNGSYDETPVELAKFQKPGFQYHRSPKNLNFAGGSNLGAKKATGKYLIFLNNDMYVPPGALRALVESIQESERIGIVGGRLLYPDLTIQHAGVVLTETLWWEHVYKGFPAEHPFVLVRRAMLAVTGACMIIERALFEKLGGFDEVFRNAYEDVDLCLRVREAGKEVIYDPRVVLFHFESMTEGRYGSGDSSRRHFMKKWAGKLVPDEGDKTLHFAIRVRDKLALDAREILEKGSPYRDVAYAKWADDPRARAYSEIMAKVLLAEETLRRAQGSLLEMKSGWSLPQVQKELQRTKNGPSFRIGRVLTWLPRKITGRE